MQAADERDRAYAAAAAFNEAIPANPYRSPELRIETREGYPFAAQVPPCPDVSRSQSIVSRSQSTREQSR